MSQDIADLKKKAKALKNAVKIAYDEYRADPKQGKAYSLSSLNSSYLDTVRMVYELQSEAGLSSEVKDRMAEIFEKRAMEYLDAIAKKNERIKRRTVKTMSVSAMEQILSELNSDFTDFIRNVSVELTAAMALQSKKPKKKKKRAKKK